MLTPLLAKLPCESDLFEMLAKTSVGPRSEIVTPSKLKSSKGAVCRNQAAMH